jgi:restriction endonuclease
MFDLEAPESIAFGSGRLRGDALGTRAKHVMRQVPLIGLLLFVPAIAVSATDRAAWSAPACIASRGTPAHGQGRCARHAHLHERMHRVHAGRLHHQAPWHAASRDQTIVSDVAASPAAIKQAPPLLLPAATQFIPRPAPTSAAPPSRPAAPERLLAPTVAPVAGTAKSPPVAGTAMSSPAAGTALSSPATGTAAPSRGRSVASAFHAAIRSDRFMRHVAPLLLWAFVIAAAMLLFRLALARRWFRSGTDERPASEPDWNSAPPASEGFPPSWRDLTEARPVELRDQSPDGPPLAPADMLTLAAVEAAVGHIEGRNIPEPATAGAPSLGVGLVEYKRRCVAALRRAGWNARTRFSAGLPGPDVIANSGDVVLTLQCHVSAEPVDTWAVKDACAARERQRSNLAAIVAIGPFTEAARQLAERTGIVLLREDQLASFAG